MSFCVKCGADGPVYDKVCKNCFLENKRFTRIPDHVNLLRCVHCREYSIDNKWVAHEDITPAVKDIALDAVEVLKDTTVESMEAFVTPADSANFRVHIDMTIQYQGLVVEEALDTIVRLKNSVCDRCSMIKGSYFEAILQIRSRDRKLSDDEVDEMLDRVDKLVKESATDNRDVFVSKIDRVVGGAGGADVYLSSNSVCKAISRQLSDQYGAEIKDTSKLVTQKEGRDVYRVTYLVRLPAYRFGDILIFKKKMFLVGPMRTTNVRLTDMKTGDSVNYSHSDLVDANVIGRREDMLDAIVLTESDREVQIMHPTNFKPVELRKPPKYKVNGETVKIFVYEEELYIVPR
jgi:nonsense-mediated mRNA decay protein 3